jgi:hypothetical protein
MSAFSNDVSVNNFPVTNDLTDAQLRATPVPVSVPGSVAVTGPLTDGQLRATPVPVSGSVSTTPTVSNTSTVTQISSTGSNQTLLAANANRKKAFLFFSSGIWNIKLGAVASGTSRTLQVSSSNFYLEIPLWTGQIDAICTTSGKLVDVTELV